MQELGEHLRAEAADCMCFEASLRVKDPVYGCVGIISQLQHEIIQTQNDIIKIKGEIAFHNAQQRQQQQMAHANDQGQGDLAAFPLVSSIEQQPNEPFDASTSAFFHAWAFKALIYHLTKKKKKALIYHLCIVFSFTVSLN